MAPVSPMTRGHGVPGGLSSEPGRAHIYLMRTPYMENQAIRNIKCADGSEPQSEVQVFCCARWTARATLRAPIPSGALPTQVSQANQTKRGLYVYQA
jgi:hypothetical protein